MIYDLHNDLLTAPRPVTSIKSEISRDADAGVKPIYAVFTTELKHPLNFCKAAKRMVPDGNFAIEDLGFISEREIEEIANLKPVYCGLTWNYDNALAGGAFGNGELTAFGKRVIEKLDAANICIDTAHLNRRSFWQVMERDPKKVICSHTAMDFINSHPRNLTKEQIYAIIMCGGIVGIAFVSEFLTRGDADIDDLTRQIISFIEKFDDDNLALGTDFYGTKHGVKCLDGYSALERLKTALITRGVSEKTVDKIFYLNAMRFRSK